MKRYIIILIILIISVCLGTEIYYLSKSKTEFDIAEENKVNIEENNITILQTENNTIDVIEEEHDLEYEKNVDLYYEKYKSLYEKYEKDQINWLINSKSYNENAYIYFYNDFNHMIEEYIRNNAYSNGFDENNEKIKMLFFPIAKLEMYAVMIVTENNTLWSNYDIKTGNYFDEFKKIKEFKSDVVDIFIKGEKVRAYDGPYFLLSNGDIINLDDSKYQKLDEEFESCIPFYENNLFCKEDGSIYAFDAKKEKYVKVKDESGKDVIVNNELKNYSTLDYGEIDYASVYFITKDNKLLVYTYYYGANSKNDNVAKELQEYKGKIVKDVTIEKEKVIVAKTVTEIDAYKVTFTDGTEAVIY